MALFRELCAVLGLTAQSSGLALYGDLKAALRSWRAQALWARLDKRAGQREYRGGTACPNTNVGPFQLYVMIEMGSRDGMIES